MHLYINPKRGFKGILNLSKLVISAPSKPSRSSGHWLRYVHAQQQNNLVLPIGAREQTYSYNWLTTQRSMIIQYYQLTLDQEQTCFYQCFKSRIENSNNQQSAGRRIFSLAFLKPFSCVGILYIIYTLSGPDTIQIYLIYILEESGSSISPNIGPIISGSLGLFCAGIIVITYSQIFPSEYFYLILSTYFLFQE